MYQATTTDTTTRLIFKISPSRPRHTPRATSEERRSAAIAYAAALEVLG